MHVGQQESARLAIRNLPERRAIEVEALADAALGVLDPTVHLAGRHIDKLR
jgi:hypothetical protein